MAMIWNSVNLQTTYDFWVMEFKIGIPKKILTRRVIPGLHGEQVVAQRFGAAEHRVRGRFLSGITWIKFGAFENITLNSLQVFANYEASAPVGVNMQMTHIDPTTTWPNCHIESFEVLEWNKTGTLAIPVEMELVIVQEYPGVS